MILKTHEDLQIETKHSCKTCRHDRLCEETQADRTVCTQGDWEYFEEIPSEIRDAKYFGARVGKKCWIGVVSYVVVGVEYYQDSERFHVNLRRDGDTHTVNFGKGISFEPFEPPDKTTTVEVEGFALWYPKEVDRLRCFKREKSQAENQLRVDSIAGTLILDGAQIVPGTLTFQIKE